MTSDTDIHAHIDFIANLPLYESEKPFFVYPPVTQDRSISNEEDLSNVQWETHAVPVQTMRRVAVPDFDQSGFKYLEHQSSTLPTSARSNAREYQKETEAVLQDHFQAELVKCYIYKVLAMEVPSIFKADIGRNV